MNKRLQKFLDAENVSQSQFADSINVARASVSHILAGRNKPGFDFVEKMARAYPMLNVEWLITGRGRMYKDSAPGDAPRSSAPVEDDLFAIHEETPLIVANPAPIRETTVQKDVHSAGPAKDVIESIAIDNSLEHIKSKRNISKIIALFDDGTFQVISI